MKDSVFRVYEQYVLNDRKIDEAQKNLVEGSNWSNYLKCMDLLVRKGDSLSKGDRQIIESCLPSIGTFEAGKISLRLAFLRYDAAKDPAEKRTILDEINKKYLGVQFNHARPAGLDASIAHKKSNEIHEPEPAALMDSLDPKAELGKLYAKEKDVTSFSRSLLCEVNFSLLEEQPFYSVLNMMGDQISMLDSDAFLKVWVAWMQRQYKKGKSFFVSSGTSSLKNLTTQQMDKMAKYLPELLEDEAFAGEYMAKKFARELDPEEYAQLSWQARRDCLLKMYEYSQSLPHKFANVRSELLLRLLETGIKLDIYDDKLLIEYLKTPARTHSVLKAREIPKRERSFLDCVGGVFSGSSRYDQKDTILRVYIMNSLRRGGSFEVYKEYVDQEELTNMWEEVQFTSGKKVELTSRNTGRLEKLATKVSIQICEHNKPVFELADDVVLHVELKNVATLFVKVFEINTENYYRKSMSPFRTDVNLDGLIASSERSFGYKQLPQTVSREQLKFPELKGKAGFYVLELIGNGKSSRAVIKIGTLSFTSVPTAEGQLCYVLDGARRVCVHESTGIWLDEKLFKADPARKGAILVPYVTGGQTRKAILLHQGLAQLVDFGREEERYSLDCKFFMLPESFIMGNKASLLMRPQLLINGRKADMKLLENVRCVIYTSNYTEEIPSTKSYTDLKPSETQELLVTFQVGGNVRDVRVELMAEVRNRSRGQTDCLRANHSFPIQAHLADCAIGELFLSLTKGNGYELLALGKNGEPLPNVPLDFDFHSSQFHHEITKKASTNGNGIVRLGAMKGVQQVGVRMETNDGVRKSWYLPNLQMVTLPLILDTVEGEEVEFTVPKAKAGDRLYCVREEGGRVIEDCSDRVKIMPGQDGIYAVVKGKGFRAGEYSLWGKEMEGKIQMRVHQGVYWPEDANYICKADSLLEAQKQHKGVRVKNVRFDAEQKDGKSYMTIEVSGGERPDWRAHVMFFRYLPEHLNAVLVRFLSRPQTNFAEFDFQRWHNFYLSNRELSTEFRYCFDRRALPRFMGNTLPKPKLLLKRTFAQSTACFEEVVNEGTKYNQEREDEMAVQKKCKCRDRSMASGVGGASGSLDNLALFQNFLAREPLTLYNIPASKDGVIKIEVDGSLTKQYGVALVVVTDSDSAAHYVQPLDGTETPKKDLSMRQPLDQSKAYCEMRTANCIRKYESHMIKDIASTDIQLVDSLEKALAVLKQIMRLQSTTVPDLSRFERLLQWEKLSEEEKGNMVSNCASHELYLFVYKKDRAYFDRVIRPYLTSKMEQTFVDQYLLGDVAGILGYIAYPARIASMNSLERALLVEILAGSGNKELAEAVLRGMKNDVATVKKPVGETNRVFDTILSMNVMDDKKDKGNLSQRNLAIESALMFGAGAAPAVPVKRMKRKVHHHERRMSNARKRSESRSPAASESSDSEEAARS